jgi:hydrogenase maturation protease
MHSNPDILVAGIGNIFLGDDAFGSEVARRLLQRPQPSGVRIVDFGIRGLDLVYALLDGCDTAILIDAAPRPNDPPGTLYLLEPQFENAFESSPALDTHSMDPVKVLRTAFAMGARPRRVLVVGCQPSASLAAEDEPCDDMSMEMSPAVTASIEPAILMIESLLRDLTTNPASESIFPESPEVLS